eukprot:TRINITY_DN1029_c0_g1_i1.p1 TRINITY_DN1029_c0_g1~~TRINITY_DN1029_c0_g1_i1.p1  ORF type:complete len:253 (+),score=47.07 TRINITY_DN1029_c0_g1_i1:703-1461(+)
MSSDRPVTTTNVASAPSDTPGDHKNITTGAIETGASAVQRLKPISQICHHLCALHNYAQEPSRQVEAHHYCSALNEDVMQCVIYDTNAKNARLIGVEFIISETVFAPLPAEEKKLWHSHEYEVKSGLLFLPGMVDTMETPIVAKVARSYGKAWHFWQYDRGDTLPLGLPSLMGAFTEPDQIKPEILKEMETKHNVSYAKKAANRVSIEGPLSGRDPNVDMWWKGKTVELQLKETSSNVEKLHEMVKKVEVSK